MVAAFSQREGHHQCRQHFVHGMHQKPSWHLATPAEALRRRSALLVPGVVSVVPVVEAGVDLHVSHSVYACLLTDFCTPATSSFLVQVAQNLLDLSPPLCRATCSERPPAKMSQVRKARAAKASSASTLPLSASYTSTLCLIRQLTHRVYHSLLPLKQDHLYLPQVRVQKRQKQRRAE